MGDKSPKSQQTQPYTKAKPDSTTMAAATEAGPSGAKPANPKQRPDWDQNPILSPGEDGEAPFRLGEATPEIRTQRVRPPRWSPRSRPPIGAYVVAAAVISLPAALWLAAALTSSPPAMEPPTWIGAGSKDKPGVVYLNPASGGDNTRLAIWREANRIHGSAKTAVSTATEWSFPSEANARLLKSTLEDTALMIPPRGPFSLGGDAAKAALLVCWKKGDEGEESMCISMLDWRGRVLWERSVAQSATLSRGYWISQDGIGCLAFEINGGNTALIDPIAGRIIVP